VSAGHVSLRPFVPSSTILTSQRHVVVVHQSVNGLDLSANVELLGAVPQDLDPWMLLVTAENFLSLLVLVRPVYVVDCNNGEVAVVAEVAESNASGGLNANLINKRLRHVEADRHGEEVAISESVVGNDAV
jgi:hypothetical protein